MHAKSSLLIVLRRGYCNNNPVNYTDPFGLSWLDWYDDLADWAQSTTNKAKCETSGGTGGWGIAGETSLWTFLDLLAGMLSYPSALGHLGEGAGIFAGDPSLENAAGLAMDVSVAASIGAATAGVIESLRTPYWQYYPKDNSGYSSPWVVRGKTPPYGLGEPARRALNLPEHNPATGVRRVPVNQGEIVRGPRPVKGGTGLEWIRGRKWQ